MQKQLHFIYIWLIFALLLSGCGPAMPQESVSIETIVAATYAAIAAQTEAARPSATVTPLPPTATRPPGTATPTPTATFVISTRTPTFTPTASPEPTATYVTSQSGLLLYACNILSLSPRDSTEVKAGKSFVWTWTVENTGNTRWDPSTMDVYFTGGTKVTKTNSFPISNPAKPGSTTDVKIKIVAPKEPGTYSTTWALRKGVHRFCYVKLNLAVSK